MVNIFSNKAKEKQLQQKIIRTCELDITQEDFLTKLICRNCHTFINKMWEFRRTCQTNQIELRQKVSIKRLNTFSPRKDQDKKKVLLDTTQCLNQPRKRLQMSVSDNKSEESNNNIATQDIYNNTSTINIKSVYNKDSDILLSEPFNIYQQNAIERAIHM